MYIRKIAAFISATLFVAAFTVFPALAILEQPSQQMTTVTSDPMETSQSTEITQSTGLFASVHRLSTQDDADLATQVVDPIHDLPESTPTPTPEPTPTPSKALPTPILEPADLAQTDDALARSQSDLNSTSPSGSIVKLPWFGEVENIYAKGDIATVIDLETGIRLQIMRTGGHNHADAETIDSTETAKLLQVAGGEWNWTRRPVIVEIDGLRIAASMTCRPHAGLDNQPALETVANRSGGFGTGINYDTIKGNDMDGHFDIHFYKSRTHGTNKVDAQHQAAIQVACESGM